MTDSDRAIERLLRGGAATPSGEPSAPCLDADTLAAWVDGRLSRAELTTAEAHAAGCARCQTMLAVMARTAESGDEAAAVAMAPRRSIWRMLPWMGPVAAAATAAAIYVAVRPNVDIVRQPARDASAPQVTSAPATEQEARQPQAALERAAPPQANRSAAAARGTERSESDRERQTAAGASTDRRAAKSASKPAEKSVALADATPPTVEQLRKLPPSAAVVAPQAPPAVSERPAAVVPPPPAPITEEAKRREAFQAGRAAASAAGLRADAVLDRTAAPLVIQSPDLDIQWRIVAGNVVQRTTDRGRTWVTQATGTTKAIAAGFSPSATVCWLVGAGGVVAVTVDGKIWTPVVFPHAIDLINVQASSADAAAVFAADGRTFTTADRGKTWK